MSRPELTVGTTGIIADGEMDGYPNLAAPGAPLSREGYLRLEFFKLAWPTTYDVNDDEKHDAVLALQMADEMLAVFGAGLPEKGAADAN